jgi:hypothetical protein
MLPNVMPIRLAVRRHDGFGHLFACGIHDGCYHGKAGRGLLICEILLPRKTPIFQNFSTHGRNATSEDQALRGCWMTCR